MDSLSHSAVKHLLWACAIAVSTFSAPTQATYRYEYTGNTFELEEFNLLESPFPFFSVGRLTAVVFSPTRLTNGSGLTAGLTFSLAGWSGRAVYPYPSVPTQTPGSELNPTNVGTFSIGAVDDSGLPTDWNISINTSFTTFTGRETSIFAVTSTNLDSVSNGFFIGTMNGSLANSPGVWTVSAVPEPQTYAMVLAGLCLMGYAARRQMASKVPLARRAGERGQSLRGDRTNFQ